MINDGKIYKYHTRLLALYDNLGLNCVKTRFALKGLDFDTVVLEDLLTRRLVTKTHYENLEFKIKDPNKSDKMSNWWKITPKGLFVLTEKFDVKFTEEEQFIIAKYLLDK